MAFGIAALTLNVIAASLHVCVRACVYCLGMGLNLNIMRVIFTTLEK